MSTTMSQDLLSELDPFYQPPPKPTARRSPSPPLQLPPAQQQSFRSRPFPRAHHTPSRSFGYGHRYSPSATTFDDLLGIMGSRSSPPPSALQKQQQRRPMSLYGNGSSSNSTGTTTTTATTTVTTRPRKSSGGMADLPPQRGTSTSELYAIDGFDDFGSFQTAGGSRVLPSSSKFSAGHVHLQSLFDSSQPKIHPNSRNSLPAMATTTANDGDGDDDFGEFVATPPYNPPPATTTTTTPQLLLFDTFGPTPLRTPEPEPDPFTARTAVSNLAGTGISLKAFTPAPKPPPSPPPETFPPVSALLQTITPLFLLAQKHLLDELRGLPFPLRQRILAHARTREFLEGVCEIGRVAGRIIAGRRRRRRWLALEAGARAGTEPVGGAGAGARARAGARVGAWAGPGAGAGPEPGAGPGTGRGNSGGGGMRLSGGGSEMQREDREVKEALRTWKEGIGRLKAAMGEAVPELDEAVLKDGGGGGASGQPQCKLCRLRCGELVPGLREKTERARWWDQGWGGHRSCRRFWERHGR